MKVPMLIESVAGNGYIVRSALGLSGEGATPAAAIRNFQAVLKKKLDAGAKVAAFDIEIESNPWFNELGRQRSRRATSRFR